MEKNIIAYKVGGLLYSPATNTKIADKIINGKIQYLTSMALCLEDSILDSKLSEAEKNLCDTLAKLDNIKGSLPLLFIRVRNAEHFLHVWKLIKKYQEVVTGFILPKFDLSNADNYIDIIKGINSEISNIKYIMPILESKPIISIMTSCDTLFGIKSKLDEIKDYVLNIRVGGNDFSNLYGLRRSVTSTVYDLEVVKTALINIYNVFGSDYVVSGPVWEYFGENTQDAWCVGLKREVELDLMNGFIGKTVIHPSQLPIVYNALKVSNDDYLDALRILNANEHESGVEKSSDGTRMNEFKTHSRWAEKIVIRKEIYGIKE